MAKKEDELNFETDNNKMASSEIKSLTGCHGQDREKLR